MAYANGYLMNPEEVSISDLKLFFEKAEGNLKNNDIFENFFLYNYQNIQRKNVGEIGEFYKKDEFNIWKEDLTKYLKDNRVFFTELLKLQSITVNSNKNEYIKKVIHNCLINMASHFAVDLKSAYLSNNLNFLMAVDYSDQYSGIIVLQDILMSEKNMIIIGANGSGKSSLAMELKKNDPGFISVINAQKYLTLSNDTGRYYNVNFSEVRQSLQTQSLLNSKSDNNYDFLDHLSSSFAKLLVGMRENHVNKLIHKNDNLSIYERMEKIFSNLFPKIKLKFTAKTNPMEIISCNRDGLSYSINGLSDGEKAAIYYILNVLIAEDNNIIVVDEPETYLNPSIVSRLWTSLINERNDCRFIFITHSVDFLISRQECGIAWINDFQYPNEWSINLLEDNHNLPQALLTEVLGSQKPILFCEGTEGSWDSQIYHILFDEFFTVIPNNGCPDVIRMTRIVNKIPNFKFKAYGLIDLDNRSVDEIEVYKKDNIFMLLFNEIEMLFMCDEILNTVVKQIYPAKWKEKIGEYKNQFWKLINSNSEKIILNILTQRINRFLTNKRIPEEKTINGLNEQIENYFDDLNINEEYNLEKDKLQYIIEDNNYLEMLKMCMLKKQITNNLGEKYLQKNYCNTVIEHLMTNGELRKSIRDNYFPTELNF